MGEKIRLVRLGPGDASEVMTLQERMLRALPSPRWYYTGTEAEMAEELALGIGVGVRMEGRLAAVSVCRPGEASGVYAYALLAGEASAAGTLDYLDIMVDPDYRRRGIHSACLRCFREMAASLGCREIWCTIDPENMPSRRSFEKAGYQPVCEKPAYDGRPRIYYRLRLEENEMENWTFDTLPYRRPDFDALRAFLTAETEKIKNAASAEEIFAALSEVEEENAKLETMINLVYIRNTLNTTDEFYEKELAYQQEVLPTIQPLSIALEEAVATSPFRPEIEAKYGRQYFVQMELSKKSFCEKNIPLMQREAQLTTEYQKIMATCAIPFDGKTLNLYGIQKYFEHDDRAVRAAAFRAYSDFYHDNEPRLEEIWAELIDIRNEMGRNLGYENYIPLGYLHQGRTDYGMEEVAAFREQVRRELVPLCEKLYDAQAKRLGIDHVMAYDEKRVFPDGNAHPAGDDDFMIAQAKEMYHEMSPETGGFIDFMIDHHLMDLKNKPGKASTGYMTSLSEFKAPFVFSCFNQTIGDMQVLSHELGHAFAGYMAMRSQPISAYYSETTDIAEIHSMAMEQFAYPWAERFFGGVADKYRFAHLQEAITFVPFGVAVDEFQHICYANPGMTPKERTMVWHELEQKYMPWRRYENDAFMERGGYWYHKLHIFLYPFYYINYTLTTMGAMEFKTKAAENREAAWEDYLRLCRVGGSMSYLETLRYANLSNPFEEGAVARSIALARDILLKEIARQA